MSKVAKIQGDIKQLIKDGDELVSRFRPKAGELPNQIELLASYQQWYSVANEVVRVLLPARLREFQLLYEEKISSKDGSNLGISEWLGLRRPPRMSEETASILVFQRLMTQLEILRAAEARTESVLFDLEGVVQADLFSSELEAATELQKAGHLRAGGVVAGVVIERHLKQVAAYHNFKSRKKKPTLGDFNDYLKSEAVIQQSMWRFVQHMGDLRNKCAHPDDEPTKQDVTDLIAGAKKIQAEVS